MEVQEILGSMGLGESRVVENSDSYVAYMVKIPVSSNMLEAEELIQSSLNEVGKQATERALSRFDTDGSPVTVARMRYTSKGLSSKYYQTPYGEVYLQRHVYQNSSGGSIYCPLEYNADIITTPRFAKIVSSKYSRIGSKAVQRDLSESNGRSVARCYIQDISEAVGAVISSRPGWTYAIPVDPKEVSSAGISLDGTCMLLCADG
jgi:nucleoside diphosphate kinase